MARGAQIVLFTDFGLDGIYTAQVEHVLNCRAPDSPVLNYVALAPRSNPRAASYLVEPYTRRFAERTVFVCVIDPGVGSYKDQPVALFADGRWYVGPDNGLFEQVRRRSQEVRTHPLLIDVGDSSISASFYGRDLYAPVAADLACGRTPHHPASSGRRFDWPDDLFEVVYVDHYGNGITGARASALEGVRTIRIGGTTVPRARTFSDVEPGEPLFYVNANGLIEVAVNLGRADRALGLEAGTPFAAQWQF